MSALRDRLAASEVLIVDGGLATELESRGHDLDDSLWSAATLLSDPGAVEAVHRSYVEAGVDIVTTATYQATYDGFAARGLEDSAATACLLAAVDLARRATEGTSVLVAGSVGPYGAFLADGSEYRGQYSVGLDALTRFHRRRLEVLADHVDVIAIETIPCRDEALALAPLLEELRGVDVWVSFSCADDKRSCGGDPIESCVEAISEIDAVVAVGVNCSAPAHVHGLLRRMATATTKPLVAYPNAGETYEDGAWTGPATSATAFAAYARTWVDAGARIVGGCCRTSTTHVQRMARAVRRPPS